MHPYVSEIAVSLASALMAGGLIGLERSLNGRAAGFRTYALVCLGSAIAMIATTYPAHWTFVSHDESVLVDPSRVIQGIVTGVGFLGAGVIFREGFSVRGLTSAASIWVTSAIGILIGIGFVKAAVVSVLLTLSALTLFHLVETRLPQRCFSVARIRFAHAAAPDDRQLTALLAQHDFRISERTYQMTGESRDIEFTLKVWSSRRDAAADLARLLAADRSVTEFGIFPAQE